MTLPMIIENSPTATEPTPTPATASPPPEKILCPHCQRTATNGIKCLGICVADSGY